MGMTQPQTPNPKPQTPNPKDADFEYHSDKLNRN